MQKKYLLQINTDNTNKDVLLNELNKVDIKDKLQVADGIATVVGLESLKTGETVKSSIILEENNSLIKQLESLDTKYANKKELKRIESLKKKELKRTESFKKKN